MTCKSRKPHIELKIVERYQMLKQRISIVTARATEHWKSWWTSDCQLGYLEAGQQHVWQKMSLLEVNMERGYSPAL